MAKKKSTPAKARARKRAKVEEEAIILAPTQAEPESTKEIERFSLLPLLGSTIVLLVVVSAFVIGRVQNGNGIPVANAPNQASSLPNFSPTNGVPNVSPGRISEGNAGSTTTAAYTFIAIRGESVSKLARKAINQYLSERGANLNRAQRLFMEVSLTNANNPVHMDIGETRTFAVQQIADLYSQATNLSQSALAAWERQASSVNYV